MVGRAVDDVDGGRLRLLVGVRCLVWQGSSESRRPRKSLPAHDRIPEPGEEKLHEWMRGLHGSFRKKVSYRGAPAWRATQSIKSCSSRLGFRIQRMSPAGIFDHPAVGGWKKTPQAASANIIDDTIFPSQETGASACERACAASPKLTIEMHARNEKTWWLHAAIAGHFSKRKPVRVQGEELRVVQGNRKLSRDGLHNAPDNSQLFS